MPQQASSYWFKRRRYGWGWFPVTWKAWTLLAAGLLIILMSGFWLLKDTPRNTFTINSVWFLGLVLVVLIALIIICYYHAPKPKWRWGTSPTDNSEEDF